MEVTPALMNALGHDADAAALALEEKPAKVSPEPSTDDVSDEDDVVDDRVSHLLEDALDRKVHAMLTEEAGRVRRGPRGLRHPPSKGGGRSR